MDLTSSGLVVEGKCRDSQSLLTGYEYCLLSPEDCLKIEVFVVVLCLDQEHKDCKDELSRHHQDSRMQVSCGCVLGLM